jgi:hypothetical protein
MFPAKKSAAAAAHHFRRRAATSTAACCRFCPRVLITCHLLMSHTPEQNQSDRIIVGRRRQEPKEPRQ